MRLFVGAFPPLEVAERLSRAVLCALEGEEVRIARPEEIHLTLCFIGEVEPTAVPELERALVRAIHGKSAPSLRVRETSAFPDLDRARVLWAGLEERAAAETRLESLAAGVRDALSPWLPEKEERWRPHLTVARGPRSLSVPDAFRRLELDLPWELAEVCLVESRRGSSGPDRFPRLATFPLSRGSA